MQSPSTALTRTVIYSRPAQHVVEGAGFEVQRAIPAAGLDAVGPFIFLDHFGPVDYAPGKALGAPDHPHAGIETLTYFLEGRGMRHRDSLGNDSTMVAGGAQWMRAGRGIVHDESPDAELLRDGGRLHGVQLWINLPRAHKRAKPDYKAFAPTDIPKWAEQDGAVQFLLIAGQLAGYTGPASSFGHPWLVHLTVRAGTSLVLQVSDVTEIAAYLLAGSGRFGSSNQPGAAGDLLGFTESGVVSLQAEEDGLDLLLLGGDPLDAPIVRYGPFVMNTHNELQQAVHDYQRGLMGKITA